MKNLTGEESNYFVLEQVSKALKSGEKVDIVVKRIDTFLEPKKKYK